MSLTNSLSSTIQPLTVGMRRWLLIGSIPPFLAGLSLFIGVEPWTIDPAITAAFFGAAYWAGFFLLFLSSRQRAWAQARVAVSAVLALAVLELVATLRHLDRFHFDSTNGLELVVTWGWMVPYVLGPVTIVLVVRQLRVPGESPPRLAPLPSWMRLVLSLQATIMIALGAALFIDPRGTGSVWPWMLTPLTGRIVGAWLVGLGVGAAHVVWENDWERILAAAVSYTFFGAFLILALVGYSGAVDWGGARAWVYLLFLLSLLGVGLYAWRGARRASPG